MDGFEEVGALAYRLAKCNKGSTHMFHCACITKWLGQRPQCPVCNAVCGVITGTQPPGEMKVRKATSSLAGHEGHGTLVITYSFPSGIQSSSQPKPGHRYHGTEREAYLPDSPAGQQMLTMFQTAFDRRLIFTIGRSLTTGSVTFTFFSFFFFFPCL